MARVLGHRVQVHGLVSVQMEGTPRALLPDLLQSKVTESLGIRMWREASSEWVSTICRGCILCIGARKDLISPDSSYLMA